MGLAILFESELKKYCIEFKYSSIDSGLQFFIIEIMALFSLELSCYLWFMLIYFL